MLQFERAASTARPSSRHAFLSASADRDTQDQDCGSPPFSRGTCDDLSCRVVVSWQYVEDECARCQSPFTEQLHRSQDVSDRDARDTERISHSLCPRRVFTELVVVSQCSSGC